MSIVAAYAVPHPPLIVPAVGRGDEKFIQATVDAFRQVADEIIALAPELIVITSPHAPCFRDAFHVTTDARLYGDLSRFRAPHERLEVDCDVRFARTLIAEAHAHDIVAVDSDAYRDAIDHATYVALHFIREAFRAVGGKEDCPCPIARIGLSGFSYEMHRKMGQAIAQTVDACERRTVFVGSGDLSHKLKEDGPYGFAPEGPAFDERIGEIFASGNLEGLFEFDPAFADAAAECGLRSFQMMAGALGDSSFESELLSLEGPFGVGYGTAAFRNIGA